MELDSPRAYWIDVVGLALASVVMFRFGLLRLLFLVPVQLVWIRRGEEGALISSGICLGAMGIVSAVSLARLGGLADGAVRALVGLDLVFVLGILVGLFLLNSPRLAFSRGGERREFTVPERFIAAVVAGIVIYGPALWLVARGESANQVIAAQIEIARPLFQATGATTEEIRALSEMVIGALLSGVLFGFILLVAGTWWVGMVIAFRTRIRLPQGNPVMARLAGYVPTQFVLPVWFVWALIASWAGVLAAITLELGGVSYVFWNAGFVTLALYAMQGISILLHFAERRKLQRGMRIGIAVALIFGLLVPGLNFVVGLGLPGLGVSEIWIDYHRLKGSEEK